MNCAVYNKLTLHFDYTEHTIACPCCGLLPITDLFYRHIRRLEMLRQKVGFRITINSGYRCAKHNREVGGGKRSMHMLFATDIRPTNGDPKNLERIYKEARELGFTGIGYYWTFIHLDLRKHPYEWDNRNAKAVKR